MNIPTFSAELSLYKSTQYQTTSLRSVSDNSVRPQAFRGRLGGISAGGNRAIHWDCNIFGDCCARIGDKWRCCFGPPYNECIDV